MAAAFLDQIINETLPKSFGGMENEALEDSLFRRLQANNNNNNNLNLNAANSSIIGDSSPSTSPISVGQLDSLAQSVGQNVDMGQYERLFWVLIFSFMVLIAAGGNIIVVYIVSTNKEMKSVTNYFLVNLSLADTMVSTLNVIFNFISMLNSHWPFGKVYCKISNFIAILSISASVFTLTAISCDRYNAILHPLRPRMSHRHAIGWILLIWTLSSALAMPNAIYSTLVEDRLVNDNIAVTCTMIWPDGRYPLSSYDHIYNIVILVVTYLVPIFTMAILYYNVGKELWGYEAIGENADKQQRAIMAKRKIVKMMIVVVIIFALCWLPYHAFFVVNYYVPTIFQDVPLHYQRCYLFMYWLAMSNSMYNPIIIYFMNSKFRHEFRKILYFLCCCRVYTPPIRAQLNQPPNAAANTNANMNTNTNTNLINANTNARTNNHTQTKRFVAQESNQSTSNLRELPVKEPNVTMMLYRSNNDNEIQCDANNYDQSRSQAAKKHHYSIVDQANCRAEANEEEPFICRSSLNRPASNSTDLNGVASEKLIDFNNHGNQSCANKQHTANGKVGLEAKSNDKVWI